MIIDLQKIAIKDVVKGYFNNDEEGVVGYDGKLNIRPKYQREFVYKDKQRDAVLHTIRKKFPLNVMYWVRNEDGSYEVLDGQQRTISICEFVEGNFSIDHLYFHTLQEDEQEAIMNYELMVYFCEGTDTEKLDWFETINIAGERLYPQELRNAIYTGTWLTDAKKHFSKSNCPAYNLAKDYMSGIAIRQDYLQTVISWISNDNIKQYMADNQHNPNANELWLYFQGVINWVRTIFPNYREEMKGIEWGVLYNKCKDKSWDAKTLEKKRLQLIDNDEVQSTKGIYLYLLTDDEKYLNLRQFDDKMKRKVYERQKGICAKCGKHFELAEMDADHIDPWNKGGKTEEKNCQMLCQSDNRRKGAK